MSGTKDNAYFFMNILLFIIMVFLCKNTYADEVIDVASGGIQRFSLSNIIIQKYIDLNRIVGNPTVFFWDTGIAYRGDEKSKDEINYFNISIGLFSKYNLTDEFEFRMLIMGEISIIKIRKEQNYSELGAGGGFVLGIEIIYRNIFGFGMGYGEEKQCSQLLLDPTTNKYICNNYVKNKWVGIMPLFPKQNIFVQLGMNMNKRNISSASVDYAPDCSTPDKILLFYPLISIQSENQTLITRNYNINFHDYGLLRISEELFTNEKREIISIPLILKLETKNINGAFRNLSTSLRHSRDAFTV